MVSAGVTVDAIATVGMVEWRTDVGFSHEKRVKVTAIASACDVVSRCTISKQAFLSVGQ